LVKKLEIIEEDSDKSSEAAIYAERVTKTFGVGKDKVVALQDVSVAIQENEFLEAMSNPLSTFSIAVDTASYSNARRFINNSQLNTSTHAIILGTVLIIVSSYELQ